MELIKEKLFRAAAETRFQKIRGFSTVCKKKQKKLTTCFFPSGTIVYYPRLKPRKPTQFLVDKMEYVDRLIGGNLIK